MSYTEQERRALIMDPKAREAVQFRERAAKSSIKLIWQPEEEPAEQKPAEPELPGLRRSKMTPKEKAHLISEIGMAAYLDIPW
jgi:hypothetical protein